MENEEVASPSKISMLALSTKERVIEIAENVSDKIKETKKEDYLRIALFTVLGLVLLSIVLAFIAFALSIIALPFLLIFGLVEVARGLSEEQYYTLAVVAGAVLFVVSYTYIYYKAGTVSLSPQSLAHRRNLLFSFVLMILIEKFGLEINNFLKMGGTLDNEMAKGILGALAVFFFFEYIYNFFFDLIKSINDTDLKKDSPLILRVLFRDIWILIIGNFRFFFDFVVPTAAFLLIMAAYHTQSIEFMKLVLNFSSDQVNEFIDGKGWREELEHIKDTGLEFYDDVYDIVSDIYKDIKEAVQEKWGDK